MRHGNRSGDLGLRPPFTNPELGSRLGHLPTLGHTRESAPELKRA